MGEPQLGVKKTVCGGIFYLTISVFFSPPTHMPNEINVIKKHDAPDEEVTGSFFPFSPLNHGLKAMVEGHLIVKRAFVKEF